MKIKEHNIYFVDFGGCFGYSCLVFKNNHSLYYTNDYALHHQGKSKSELQDYYIKEMNGKLFTEAEISAPLESYSEYRHKSDYLRNYYGMQVDSISIFSVNPTEKQKAEIEEYTKNITYNPVCFCYMNDKKFVEHHIQLMGNLNKAMENCADSFEYQKEAFLYEMYNHEYGINWQADYDVLSIFGKIKWHEDDLNAYFEELKFTDLQKKAYLDAIKQYFAETAENFF